MEMLPSLCFIGLCTLLVVWFLKLSSGKSKPAAKPHLPPGPWTLPIIGSLHHVASVLPHRSMMELSHRYGPLMHLTLGEVPTVIVSSAEAATLVMKTKDPAFADRPNRVTPDIISCGGKGLAFAPYGGHWRQMRKVCIVELLSSKQVKRMEGIRAKEVANLIRSMTALNGATVNISEKMATLSNNIVSRAVFGGKFPQQEEYLRELDKISQLMGGFCLVDLFPSSRLARWLSSGERLMKKSQSRMQHIMSNIIEGHKAARAASHDDDEDLLDVLLRLQRDDTLEFPLTTESINTVLFDVLSAATETTGNVLEWAMSELVRHPKIMSKAQREIRKVLGQDRAIVDNNDLHELHYMRTVIKEVLRLHPPVPLLPRSAIEDCKIMDCDMVKGTNVYINVYAVSRDPRYWKNPEEFKPERFEENNMDYNGTYTEYTPFGAGRRQCPGILFGTSTLNITLANLLYHFDWILPDGVSLSSLDMSEKFGITVGRRYDLQLRAIPHV
ncbi:cytochrome P450 71D7 [Aegilops tauschii subsp. strangulata]|nr:cytochrome P450 71D7 [Aegilops tauschii subsp. strangulata]